MARLRGALLLRGLSHHGVMPPSIADDLIIGEANGMARGWWGGRLRIRRP
ncbi:hypothetical protein [Neoroseomonas soli]|uniref:Uncharacterized protein n=1 Tax=Neoroseomonas soli TaxID=1081025 RepID=A0A9X9WXI5_9PROT|nr:hypothetical protein [Neoroseomonas soli]MBR0671864.1 hypothetical protein [Neoroseomonas soli]